MASPEFETFYEAILARNQQPIDPHASIQEVRAGFERALADCPPDPDIVFHPLSIGPLSLLRCTAPNALPGRIILFFHAGGYNAGSNTSHRDLMGRLSRASQSVVMGVDYRLAPEHPFPAALEDALTAYEFLLRDPSLSSGILLGGISAGGGLILSLLFQLREKKRPFPRALICFSPWVDLAMKAKSLIANNGKDLISRERLEASVRFYCTEKQTTQPLVSPLYGDFSGFPPLFIQVGAREVLLDEVVSLAQKTKNQRVATEMTIWPEMVHGWPLFAKKLPEGRKALEQAGAWAAKNFSP